VSFRVRLGLGFRVQFRDRTDRYKPRRWRCRHIWFFARKPPVKLPHTYISVVASSHCAVCITELYVKNRIQWCACVHQPQFIYGFILLFSPCLFSMAGFFQVCCAVARGVGHVYVIRKVYRALFSIFVMRRWQLQLCGCVKRATP